MRGSWREALRTAADLGYDGVELAVRDPSQVDAEAVLRTVRDAGLAVPAIGTGQAYLKDGLSLSYPDEGIRARAIERLETHIRIATVFGAAVIVGLLPGRVTPDPAATEARLSGALRRILPLAEREKIPVVFEPVNRYETDFLVTMEEVLDLINPLGSPPVGILAGTFRMYI